MCMEEKLPSYTLFFLQVEIRVVQVWMCVGTSYVVGSLCLLHRSIDGFRVIEDISFYI